MTFVQNAAVRQGGSALTRWFTERIWSELGGNPEALERVTVAGEGDLGVPFALLDLSAAAFASVGLAVSELLGAVGVSGSAVEVDRLASGAWFDVPMAPTRFIDTPDQHGIHSRWMAEYQTAYEHWGRVQAGFPTLRRRLCAALGVREEPEDVARAFRELAADDVGERLESAGAVAAVSRSMAEWAGAAQGQAVATEPLAAIRSTLTRTAR